MPKGTEYKFTPFPQVTRIKWLLLFINMPACLPACLPAFRTKSLWIFKSKLKRTFSCIYKCGETAATIEEENKSWRHTWICYPLCNTHTAIVESTKMWTRKKNENVMLGHYTNSSHMRAERARAIFIQRQFGLSILSTLHMHELLGHSMALMLKLAHSHKI